MRFQTRNGTLQRDGARESAREFESISIGSYSLEHCFEREINLYGKTKKQIERKCRETLKKFREKMREIEEHAEQAVLEDLKGLNLIEACWDFTVFINAKG